MSPHLKDLPRPSAIHRVGSLPFLFIIMCCSFISRRSCRTPASRLDRSYLFTQTTQIIYITLGCYVPTSITVNRPNIIIISLSLRPAFGVKSRSYSYRMETYSLNMSRSIFSRLRFVPTSLAVLNDMMNHLRSRFVTKCSYCQRFATSIELVVTILPIL